MNQRQSKITITVEVAHVLGRHLTIEEKGMCRSLIWGGLSDPVDLARALRRVGE